MLTVNFLSDSSVIQVVPSAKVTKASVTKGAKNIRNYLAAGANALLIETENFEDWDSFANIIEPLIAEDYRSAIEHIAICTNKPTGDMGKVLRALYTDTPLNIYCFFELELAMQWLSQETAESVA